MNPSALLLSMLIAAAISVHAQTNHDSISTCVLVPTVSHTRSRNTPFPPHSQRVDLTSPRLGRITFLSDVNQQIPNEVRGELPSELTASPEQPRSFHIHDFGDLRTNSSQGEHFVGSTSDTAAWHDVPPHTPRHAGDMGNLESQKIQIRNVNGSPILLWSLDGAPESGVIGHSAVIHAKKDQGAAAQPSGAAGERLFHCVLGIANKEGNKARAGPAASNVAIADLYSAAEGVSWEKLYGRALFVRTPEGQINVEVRTCGLQGLGSGARNENAFRVDVHTYGDLSGETLSSNVGPILKHVDTEAVEEEDRESLIGMLGNIAIEGANRGVFKNQIENVDLNDYLGRSVVVKRAAQTGTTEDIDRMQPVLVGVVGVANTTQGDAFNAWIGMDCFGRA